MALKKHVVFPKQKKFLEIMGENLKLARKRRKLTMEQAAQRAGMDRGTLRQVERGNPSISIGAYVNVLSVYELQEDLLKIAGEDLLGRKLQDLQLLA